MWKCFISANPYGRGKVHKTRKRRKRIESQPVRDFQYYASCVQGLIFHNCLVKYFYFFSIELLYYKFESVLKANAVEKDMSIFKRGPNISLISCHETSSLAQLYSNCRIFLSRKIMNKNCLSLLRPLQLLEMFNYRKWRLNLFFLSKQLYQEPIASALSFYKYSAHVKK